MAKRTLLLAVSCLAAALTVPPEPAAAGNNKDLVFAVSLARKGLWKEATFRFQSMVEKNPRNPRLWNNLAVAYEATGLFDRAHEAYEQAASLAGELEPLELNRSGFEAFYAVWSGSRSPDTATDTNPNRGGEAGG